VGRIGGARHRLVPLAPVVALSLVVFQVRRAGGTLRFGHQPPLRFVVSLLLTGSFLFILLKGRTRFFGHGVSSLHVWSRDPSTDRRPLRDAILAQVDTVPLTGGGSRRGSHPGTAVLSPASPLGLPRTRL